jgi:NAD(P)-dependent dehydrogenase (short-subunit alcohol dehydrogenase family)
MAPPVIQLTSGQNSGMGQSPAVSDVELVEETTTIVPSQVYRDVLSDFDTTGVSHSAAMSQIVLLPEDAGTSEDAFPPGAFDINGQQLDLRSVNSWVLKMDQVSTPEVVECFFVNAIAPFVLSARLVPLLCAGGDAATATASRPDRFIVNVSSMEGKFSRQYKSPNHPHTNMAKSALNMLTRTSAEDLAACHRVYMNSVDTGWINDENPLERAATFARTDHFQTPLDEIDAAARVLDPIFSSLNGEVETPVWGKFLKDYKVTEW